jgi:predicted ATP-grasp superfamily ATP-dependent carboligase
MKPKPAAKLTWKSVQSTVADAKAASERLLRDASRYVQKIREANDTGLVSKMSDIMDALQGNIKMLTDCQMWENITGTEMVKNKVEEWMGKLADKTDQANEKLEELKAICKARGLLCLACAEEQKSDPRCRGAYPLITAPSLFRIQILMTCWFCELHGIPSCL